MPRPRRSAFSTPPSPGSRKIPRSSGSITPPSPGSPGVLSMTTPPPVSRRKLADSVAAALPTSNGAIKQINLEQEGRRREREREARSRNGTRGFIEGVFGDEDVKGKVVRTVVVGMRMLKRAVGLWVFALEAIVKSQPDAGILITFTQFSLIALLGYFSNASLSHRAPFFLPRPQIPLLRWIPNVILFFLVNVLNNHAFGYHISVPVHIILRSGGSVTTMFVGWLWGKRFSRVQVIAVALLTVGVVVAAMGDAEAKGKTKPVGSKDDADRSADGNTFLAGLAILFLAQLLSAIMGLYIQLTYEKYGQHWRENLFYSHLFSLPLFLPFFPSIISQFRALATSPLMTLSSTTLFLPFLPPHSFHTLPELIISLPHQIINLLLNATSQILCITGVNLLGARTSALTVTIVLNLRKLISLLVSLWVFGNELGVMVLVGAAMVFGAGGVYGWEGGRLRMKAKKEMGGGKGEVGIDGKEEGGGEGRGLGEGNGGVNGYVNGGVKMGKGDKEL
ncbi:MAG: golgi uridine diphosphate-N- acetylglucosamine transporter [Caeruleum heppii]|nr:MAG: golgi uridine diphosphate-N- acetylglucosamine transporter [Caeruleum heppii]